MLGDPTRSAPVTSVAVPFDSVDDPSDVAPSEKETVPLGVPEDELTVEVRVTAWPKTVGLTSEPSVVGDDALLTVWVTAGLVLARKLPSPPYEAVKVCCPVDSVETTSDA